MSARFARHDDRHRANLIDNRPMDELELLVDLHLDGPRQGPGGAAATQLAIDLADLRGRRNLAIADVGCGTGAATLVLARELDVHLTATDFVPAFLARLERAAARAGLSDRITPVAADMAALPFADAALDAIFAEGAIYNLGFAAGIAAWRRYLKPGGILAVSELTWFSARRPAELERHWQREYPEVDTAAAKLAVLEDLGFGPIGYFVLPRHCWLDNYYRPLQARFPAFLDRHGHAPAAAALVAAEVAEIALYERYGDYFGYGYYVARKLDEASVPP